MTRSRKSSVLHMLSLDGHRAVDNPEGMSLWNWMIHTKNLQAGLDTHTV